MGTGDWVSTTRRKVRFLYNSSQAREQPAAPKIRATRPVIFRLPGNIYYCSFFTCSFLYFFFFLFFLYFIPACSRSRRNGKSVVVFAVVCVIVTSTKKYACLY